MQLDKNKPALAVNDVEGNELLTAMAICLNDLVNLVNKGTEVPPSSVNLLNFMLRIRRYGKCSESCFLVALVYLDRIVNASGYVLTSHNVHRVMLTAVMVAAKFHEDHFYNNAFFAKLGELTLEEINTSEIELLQQLRFSLVVTTDLYSKYHHQLCCYRERARALAKAQDTRVVAPQAHGALLVAQPVLMALPVSPGGSVLPGYHHSPPGLNAPMAQSIQPLHVPPPPGLTRAIPLYGHQQPNMVYQVKPMPMPVALPVTPVLSYNTPPLMAKLPVYHQQQYQQQHQQQQQPYY